MLPIAWNPVGDILDEFGNFWSDVLRNTVAALIQGVTEAIKAVSTWFLYLPSPVLQGEETWSPAERVQGYTAWAVTAVGIIGTAIALVMVARRKDADTAIDTAFGLMRVVIVSGAVIPGTYLLLQFSDQASPWLLNNIAGGTLEDGLGQMTGLDAAAAAGMETGVLVLLIPVLLIGLLGGLLNMIMIMFNNGALPVVVGLMPVVAAWAMTARGRGAFARVSGWLAAMVLFKPVAAVIFGVGIASARMITGGIDDAGQAVMQALYGCVLLGAAGIALPAVARLVAPAIAAGTQGGGGGGMLVGAAMLATGAVTGGATAVAGVAARGGMAAASSGGGAVATGAASTGGAAAGSGAAASSAGAGSSAGTGAASAAKTAASSAPATESATPAAAATPGGATAAAPSAPTSAPATSGPTGGQWAQRWRAEGAEQIRSQLGRVDNAVEAGDER